MDRRVSGSCSRALLRGVLLALPLFGCGDPPAPNDPGAGHASSRVERQGERYAVVTRGSPAGDTLADLARAAGFTVEVGEATADWGAEPVTLDLHGVSLTAAIHAVLDHVPHHLHYEWESGATPGGPPWPEAPVALTRVTVGALYRPPPWRRTGPGPSGREERSTPGRNAGRGPEDRGPGVRTPAVAGIDPSRDGVARLGGRVAELVQHRDARIRAAARDFVDWVEE